MNCTSCEQTYENGLLIARKKRKCTSSGVAVTHEETTVNITHAKNREIVLTVGGKGIIVSLRTRDFAFSGTLGYDLTDAGFCEMGLNDYFAYVIGNSQRLDSATYSDKYVAEDAVIEFMDLRTDIVVYRTEHYEQAMKLDSDETVNWFYGTSFPLHKLVFPSVTTQHTTTATVDGVALPTTTETLGYGSELYLALPPFPGYSQTTDPYYLFSDHARGDGGYDLYWPEWLHALGYDFTMDYEDRDRHYGLLYDGSFVPGSGDTDIIPVAVDPAPYGSYAVDKDGNKFYDRKQAGQSYTLLQDVNGVAGNAVTTIGTGTYYPIAPL